VLTIEYLADGDAKAGVYLQGRYELALVDADQDSALTFADAGGVQNYGSPEMNSRDESVNVSVVDGGKVLLLGLADTRQLEVHQQETARVYQITLAEGLFRGQSKPLSAIYSLWQFAESE